MPLAGHNSLRNLLRFIRSKAPYKFTHDSVRARFEQICEVFKNKTARQVNKFVTNV